MIFSQCLKVSFTFSFLYFSSYGIFEEFLYIFKEKPGIKIVEYHKQKKTSFRDFIMSGISEIYNAQVAGKLGLPKDVVNDMNGFNSYPAYLYRP